MKSHEPRWSAQDVLLSKNVSGQTILLHVPTGTYLSLDDSAARIVDLLNRDPDLERAATSLVERFGIHRDRALNDVKQVMSTVGGMSAVRTGRGRIPTLSGARSVFAAWRRQKWPFRLLILRVAAVVAAIEVGLRVTDVVTLARCVGVPLVTDGLRDSVIPQESLSEFDEHDQRLYIALWWVMNRWLYDGTCLRRALAFGWFLRRRKPVLRLGMTNDDDATAHAWIEVDGKSIDSQSVTMDFTSIKVTDHVIDSDDLG